MPQISVIVPVYKVEPYLHRCVDSILAQTFTDFEMILVDDGSPDNCGKICDEYAEKDSRVKVIHQENGGLSAARNAGLDWVFANSSSEWISFADSDDYVAENYLECLHNAAKDNDADLSMCGFQRVDEDGNETENSLKFNDAVLSKMDAFQLIADHPWLVVSWGKLYRRVIFDDIRFPLGKLHEDEFIIHKILWKCTRIMTISNQLYFYVDREKSIVNTQKVTNYLDALEGQLNRCFFAKSISCHSVRNCWKHNFCMHAIAMILQLKKNISLNI